MEYSTDESLPKGRRTAVLIGCVMIFSVLLYAVFVEYITWSKAPFAGFSPLPPDVFDKLRLVLLGVCPLDFAMIPYLRKSVLSSQNRARTTQAGRPLTPTGRLVSASTISFALCEAIAVYGLVLFLINGARRDFYIFFCLSLLAFAFCFPREERWLEWLRKINDAAGQGELSNERNPNS